MRGDTVGARVRGDYRLFSGIEDIEKRGLIYMRDIDYHSQPVHFGDHFASEISQAAGIIAVVGAGAAPVKGSNMGQGQIPDSFIIEVFDIFELIFDGHAVFDGQKSSYFSGCDSIIESAIANRFPSGRQTHIQQAKT